MIPELMIAVLAPFAQLFSRPTWLKIQVMFIGAILCQGRRCVTDILRIMGLGNEKRFEKYHRVLNRDVFNPLLGSKILFGLLVDLLPPLIEIIVVMDDTLERRKGKHIKAKGCYRDAVRSSQSHVVTAFGLKWLSCCLIIQLPWSKRPWSLPFLTLLQCSKKYNEKHNHRHRTSIDYATIAIKLISRWIKGRPVIFLGDGGFACIKLARACVEAGNHLISRLRLDARLYSTPKEAEPGKRGRKAQKGTRITTFKEMLKQENSEMQTLEIEWYGGVKKTIQYRTGIALMHKTNEGVLPIRWVLVKDTEGQNVPLFSTNIDHDPKFIIETFVKRFGIEIMFEESRAHLGMETQRQWSDKAILRSTPMIFSLFSFTCLAALRLRETENFQVSTASWYFKTTDEATFSDIISFVRDYCWKQRILVNSEKNGEMINLKMTDILLLIKRLSASP